MSKSAFASDILRSFVNRIERLNEEREALSADIREVFAEAKGSGFDTKILRQVIAKRKLDKADYQEQEAMFDLYWSAVGFDSTPLARSARPVPKMPVAESGDRAELPPKLVEKIAQAVQTKAGRAALGAAVDVMIERVDAETGEIIEIPAGSQAGEHGLPDKTGTEASALPAHDRIGLGPVGTTGKPNTAPKPVAVASAAGPSMEIPACLDRRSRPPPRPSA